MWSSLTNDLQTEIETGVACVGVADIRWMPDSDEKKRSIIFVNSYQHYYLAD